MAYNIQSAVDNKHKRVDEFEVTNTDNNKAQLCCATKMEMEALEVDYTTSITGASITLGQTLLNVL